MKWRDSGGVAEGDEKAGEADFEEEQYSPWAERKQRKGAGLQKKHLILLAAAAGLVIVIAIVTVLIGGGSEGTSDTSDLDARMRRLEERLARYDSIDEKVTKIWEQAKAFESFKDRFDRSEASISLRMDHLTMNMEALEKKMGQQVQARPPAPVAAAAADNASGGAKAQAPKKLQYHEVNAGDTFYSISKQYNIGVEDLLRLNHMKADSVIQPGQKLIVRSN